MFGKPVIKGTRITVEIILRKLAAGMTVEEILADHPHLTPEGIYAAAACAADLLSGVHVAPVTLLVYSQKGGG
jgi:uncharacterized protein (DUF433 family)